MKGVVLDVEQGSPEWHNLRNGRVTASRINLLLRSPEAFAKEWIRDQQGRGFKGNEATRYGQDAEPLAADWYARNFGVTPRTIGFVVDEEDPHLGCSPDRLMNYQGGETVLEIKCPFSKAIPDEPDQDHVAQVQCQLGILGLPLGILLYWTPDEARVFRIPANPVAFERMREAVRDFFARLPDYQEALEAEEARRSDAEWQAAAEAWGQAKYALEAAAAAEEAARHVLLTLANDANAEGCGVKVQWIQRPGAVAWAKLAKELKVPQEKVEEFRGQPVRYAKVDFT